MICLVLVQRTVHTHQLFLIGPAYTSTQQLSLTVSVSSGVHNYPSLLLDPYVKVCLVHKGKKVHRWKSTVKKNTLTPVFNEQFHFGTHHMDLNDMRLDLVVMDYDRFSRDDFVGFVEVGPQVPNETGCAHWEEMVGAPYQAISRWHSILPSSELEHAHTM